MNTVTPYDYSVGCVIAYLILGGLVCVAILATRAVNAVHGRRLPPAPPPASKPQMTSLPPTPAQHPGRPVDGDVLTPDQEDQLAIAFCMLTRYPLVNEPERNQRP